MTPCVIPFRFPGVPGVRAAFTTAWAGPERGNVAFSVSREPRAVRENRLALSRALGFSGWCSLKQVHGVDMVFDPSPVPFDSPSALTADGSATCVPDMALVIKTADCQPILLAHESGRYVAALHVGWRGNVLGFPLSGVEAFCGRYGVPPGELWAVRGPSLGPAASEFTNFEAEFGQGFKDFFDPATRTVDLWRLTRHQLAQAGLRPERVLGVDLCTHTLPEFHSYRRDRAASGRQASLIWIEPQQGGDAA